MCRNPELHGVDHTVVGTVAVVGVRTVVGTVVGVRTVVGTVVGVTARPPEPTTKAKKKEKKSCQGQKKSNIVRDHFCLAH